MAFQNMQGMYRPTRLVQGATNLVSAYVRVSGKCHNAQVRSVAEIFVNNVGGKGAMSPYGEAEVEMLPGVHRFVMQHLQNHDNILANVERSGATLSGEKSDCCWNGVRIVKCDCGEAGRWQQASKVSEVCIWPWRENRTEYRPL